MDRKTPVDNETPIIFDTSDGQQLRINMIGSWLRRQFGRKIIKLSLDGGFTCPNRDGSKGWGGCLFCSGSGSGDMASRVTDNAAAKAGSDCALPGEAASAREQVASAMAGQIQLLSTKWPEAGYIAYFQSHTGTYAPAPYLRELFQAAIEPGSVSGADHDSIGGDVVGLAIATRSDCISDEVLDLLTELNERTFLWVELGLQTIHSETARAMNLCHTLEDYDDALRRLSSRGIRVVTHLILGLPGETEEMMMDSVKYVCRPLPSPYGSASSPCDQRIFGLKLHMLNVVKGSGMATAYPEYVPFDSIDEYTDLLIRALELVPPEITVHRISGDAPRSILIAPEWSFQKRTILNEIHRKMRQRNTWQGKRVDGSAGKTREW